MEYKYKPNWENAKKMFEAYWHQENEGRCLLSVRAQEKIQSSDPSFREPQEGESLEKRWLDADNIIEKFIHYFEKTYFAAEAIPMVNVNLGPGVTASYFGSPFNLQERTVWFKPIITDWKKDSIEFDQNSFMWQKTLEITKKACEIGKGKFFVNQTDLSGMMDILAHLRGTEELLYDLFDCPDEVKKARDRVLDTWFQCVNKLYDITKSCNDGGSLSWLAVWSPGLCHALQCDFGAMISPSMFEEFVMPEIYRQCTQMPYSIFHLDGPGMVGHLDLLLEIQELNAIQWQPGDGAPEPFEWPDLLKKIQKKGKSIHTWVRKHEDVYKLLEFLSPKGLYIDVYESFKSREEADDFIKEVEKKCKNK